MKVTEYLLQGSVADVTSNIPFQAAALPVAHNVASVTITAISSTCAALGQPLDPHPEDHKMLTPGTGSNADCSTEEEGTNIRARKVRKIPIIIIIIIIKIIIKIIIIIIIIIKLSQNHHNRSIIYAIINLLSRPHI